MKRFGYALLVVLLLLGVGVAAAIAYVRTSAPDPDGTHRIATLSAPVEVWRDSLGVPHIQAANEADLFRAIGFVHAQDRLFQMEMARRLADGRLAEVLGEEMVESDRFLRTVGLGHAAAANEPLLAPEDRALLQAYAEGVNAWIEGHGGPLPPEFIALRFRPEPWTVRNTLSVGKVMAWDLADWNTPLDLQRAVDRVGPELASDLHPPYPDWGTHIVGAGARWSAPAAGERAPRPTPAPAAAALGIPLPRIPAPARELLEGVSVAHASNSWVIGGSRTRSGKPILANDMHLALRAPSLWYLAALRGGDIASVGMTLPGIPLVIAGRTDAVAWGFTNAMVADVDFFVERVDSTDSARYLTPDGWRPFEVRPETIRVRGAEPVVHLVRSSRNGPVLSDVESRGGGRVLAMRWTALEPSNEAAALLRMNRARDLPAFLEALRRFDNPHQNVVFADREGNFGYRLVGRIPVRRSGTGALPVPGWTGEHDWVRFLDPAEHPEWINPAEGFVVTANNRQFAGPKGEGAGAYPFQIGRDWAEPFRAQRIRTMVEAGTGLTADDVARQQMDLRDAFAERYLGHAVRAAEAAGDAEAAATLRTWDLHARPDSRGAALFYTWYETLRRRVGADEFRGDAMYFPRAALNRILDTGGGRWVDDVTTERVETLDEQMEAALRDAVREVAGRPWGELHRTEIRHPLGRVRALDRMVGFNVAPFARGGSAFTVDVAGHGNRIPFVNTHGASQRHVVDMADPDGTGGFVIPTGQSGVPFSRHYRDQTDRWREGRLWPIPLRREQAEARTVHRMHLRP